MNIDQSALLYALYMGNWRRMIAWFGGSNEVGS